VRTVVTRWFATCQSNLWFVQLPERQSLAYKAQTLSRIGGTLPTGLLELNNFAVLAARFSGRGVGKDDIWQSPYWKAFAFMLDCKNLMR
jgi:hypothetical protein